MDFVRKYGEHSKKLIQLNVEYIRGGLERHRQAKARGALNVRGEEVLREADCCFVMSTGRCGTSLLTKLLSKSRRLWPVHEPSPEMIYASSEAYRKRNADPEVFRLAALGARYDLVEAGYLRGRTFVDTHPAMSFFCPALSQVFQKSKFIHLVRHPGDYARSVLRRDYYTDRMLHNGLLVPSPDDPVRGKWEKMSRTEKVAWLWNEHQGFAEAFKSEVEENRVLTVRAEDLFGDVRAALSIFQFLGVPQPLATARLARLLRHPVNVQKSGNVPPFSRWPESEKESLRRWAPHASTYGYDLS